MAKQYGLNIMGIIRVFRKDKQVQSPTNAKKVYDISDVWMNVSEKNEDGTYFNQSIPLIFKRNLALPENNTLIELAGFPMITGNVKGDKDYRRVAFYIEDWKEVQQDAE